MVVARLRLEGLWWRYWWRLNCWSQVGSGRGLRMDRLEEYRVRMDEGGGDCQMQYKDSTRRLPRRLLEALFVVLSLTLICLSWLLYRPSAAAVAGPMGSAAQASHCVANTWTIAIAPASFSPRSFFISFFIFFDFFSPILSPLALRWYQIVLLGTFLPSRLLSIHSQLLERHRMIQVHHRIQQPRMVQRQPIEWKDKE